MGEALAAGRTENKRLRVVHFNWLLLRRCMLSHWGGGVLKRGEEEGRSQEWEPTNGVKQEERAEQPILLTCCTCLSGV